MAGSARVQHVEVEDRQEGAGQQHGQREPSQRGSAGDVAGAVELQRLGWSRWSLSRLLCIVGAPRTGSA